MTTERTAQDQDIWVFAYGSLMWNPGFAYAEARPARLMGYHRAFCIYSVHYRGTQKRPGLVLGLDRGGTCDGIAYRLAPEIAAETLAYLRATRTHLCRLSRGVGARLDPLARDRQ